LSGARIRPAWYLPRMHPDYARIYATVARVPAGRVATYGQIAAFAGLPGRARQVGYALHALPPGSPVPWQRIVNARGEISLPGASAARQRALLHAEGVAFDESGRIDLRRHLWTPHASRTRAASSAKTPARPSATRTPASRAASTRGSRTRPR
jgi:methylated-DNA-protein-cysteine methyltransferase related protein